MSQSPKKHVQGELFFDQGDTVGYDAFQAQVEGKKKELADNLGIPLGKRVVVRFRHVGGEHEGVLKLAKPHVGKSEAAVPELKIGKIVFRRKDIESIRVIPSDPGEPADE